MAASCWLERAKPNSAIDSYYGVGILRSTNHGESWTLILTRPATNPSLSFAGLGFAKFAWGTSPATTVVAATATTAQRIRRGRQSRPRPIAGSITRTTAARRGRFRLRRTQECAINPASISATDVVYNAALGNSSRPSATTELYLQPTANLDATRQISRTPLP